MIGKNISQEWQNHDRAIVECRLCPRLMEWREQVAERKRKAYREQVYWGKPVSGFGDHHAKALVLGLAPGAHGSNRTGRMFTGDASGVFLYSALYQAGFANQSSSLFRDDGMNLKDIFISSLCRCVPPDNKPTQQEIFNCQPFLRREIELLSRLQGFVALGRLAFDNLLLIYQEYYHTFPVEKNMFRHGVIYKFEQNVPWLLASYHPSQQNTRTGKLTQPMFGSIWDSVRKLLVDEKI